MLKRTRLQLKTFCLIRYFYRFHTIYSGPLTSYKVNKLQENTVYRFRICASNSTGIGPVSAVYEFTTAFTHPAPIKSKLLFQCFLGKILIKKMPLNQGRLKVIRNGCQNFESTVKIRLIGCTPYRIFRAFLTLKHRLIGNSCNFVL